MITLIVINNDRCKDMKGHGSRRKNVIVSGILFLASVFPCLFPFAVSLAADECEIVRTVFYERRQGEIVTDLDSGIPYRRFQIVTYPCATLTIRDNSRLMYTKDIEVEATFADQNTIVKKAWCDKKQIQDGEIYSCTVCFESDSPVSKVTCTFK